MSCAMRIITNTVLWYNKLAVDMQPFKGNSVCCVRLRKEKKKTRNKWETIGFARNGFIKYWKPKKVVWDCGIKICKVASQICYLITGWILKCLLFWSIWVGFSQYDLIFITVHFARNKRSLKFIVLLGFLNVVSTV